MKATLRQLAQENRGNRDAWMFVMILKLLRKNPKEMFLRDSIISMILKSDAKFYNGVARSLKAKPNAATSLFAYVQETPDEYCKTHVYSIAEIQRICKVKIDGKTAINLARLAGLKMRGRGRPKLSGIKKSVFRY